MNCSTALRGAPISRIEIVPELEGSFASMICCPEWIASWICWSRYIWAKSNCANVEFGPPFRYGNCDYARTMPPRHKAMPQVRRSLTVRIAGMNCKRAGMSPIDNIEPRNHFVGGTRGVLPHENVIASANWSAAASARGKAGARICSFFDATSARPDYRIVVAGLCCRCNAALRVGSFPGQIAGSSLGGWLKCLPGVTGWELRTRDEFPLFGL